MPSLEDVSDVASFIQMQKHVLEGKQGGRTPQEHYWPHARGKVHHYSQTPYSVPLGNNTLAWRWDAPTLNTLIWGALIDSNKDIYVSSFTGTTKFSPAGEVPLGNDTLAWSWTAPTFNTIIWGALIDSNKDIYVSSLTGTTKFSPAGEVLWESPVASEMPTLVGDTLVGMTSGNCMAFALSLATGELLWQKQVWPTNGAHGDFVEAHNGVAVVGVGMSGIMGSGGAPSERAAGLDLETQTVLWTYKLDCGIWNVMALFPDEDTTIVNDKCGGLYRFGLRNGTLLWKSLGPMTSFTDGGAILGPDGDIYSCSNPANTNGQVGEKGVLHKHRLSDGHRLWEVELPYPCVNFPGVSKDGRSVIVAPGALAIEAATKQVGNVPGSLAQQRKFYQEQERLVKLNQQRSAYGLQDLEAAVMSFNAETGELQWRYNVEPYGGLAFASDERRAWNFFIGGHTRQGDGALEHCWPAHWSAPTIDDEGTVYIGRSSGVLYAIRPEGASASTFYTGDGTLMAGAAFAPGIMVWTTCSSVFVFKSPESHESHGVPGCSVESEVPC